MYTSGIIPPKIPSTPTTDTTDEINEREPFDKPRKFRPTPEPYLGDSRYNNEDDDDDDDSESMFGIREHNRERLAQQQAESKRMKDCGTQIEEKSTRTIGTMSEPVATRNAGNEVQPQSSSTQTADLFAQPQPDKDEIQLQQTDSQPYRNDPRMNEYYPSQRSTSVDPRMRNKAYSSMERPRKDHLEHDQYRPRHRSHYHDDPRDQYITSHDDYQPYPSSRSRHRRPSPTSPHHTPPPPAQYRSTSPYDRYRTPSPSDRHRLPPTQRSRSRSPSSKKHMATSTNQHSSRSPPSHRHPRPAQRSNSPPISRHYVSSSPPRRSPSPQTGYRSPLPPRDDSRRSKYQPQKVSIATDTSIDRLSSRQHQPSQSDSPSTREFGTSTSPVLGNHQRRPSYTDYQKLDSNPPKHQDHYKSSRDNQPPSTRKNYRLRPKANDSYTNNYEEIPAKNDESNSSPYIRAFDRTKEHSPKPFSDDRRRPAESPTTARRFDEEQYPKTTINDETTNDNDIRELPADGSISIRSTSLIQPDSIPRSRGQKKSPARIPLFHGEQRMTPPRRDSSLLNFGTTHFQHQSPMNEIAMPLNIRYLSEPDDEFATDNFNIRTSTWKRDALRDKANRILLLPVLNSSRTYVFEKQPLPERQLRQSRTNGNFYLATSPPLRSLNSSFHEGDLDLDPVTHNDPDNLTGPTFRTQVA